MNEQKTVYVAQRKYDYEGFYILGIYNTREQALEAVLEDSKFGDTHSVEEFVIGKFYQW